MTDLKIEHWPLSRLRPYEKNPRKNDHAVNRMVGVLKEFGFRVPVLAKSDGQLVDGHLRYKAALEMGLETVPVILADDMTEAQIRAFRIMINRSATWADWDEDLLLQELQALQLEDFDLSLTGFDQKELDDMLMDLDGDKDPDVCPEMPENPVVREGEVWILGRHRLMCGDTTRATDCERLLAGKELDMVWTDPPYNVEYSGGMKRRENIKNDRMPGAEFENFLSLVFAQIYKALRPGSPLYVAHPDAGDGLVFRRAFISARFKFSGCLIWRKQHVALGRSDYRYQHEPILYGWKPGAPHRWYGNRKQKSVFEWAGENARQLEDGTIQLTLDDQEFLLRGENLTVEPLPTSVFCVNRPTKSKLHPTMKPVALIEKMVSNSSPRGGLVGDFFGGSGSTLIACEKLGRSARLMELDPRFAEVIIRRWQDFTGDEAVREKDDLSFDEVKKG